MRSVLSVDRVGMIDPATGAELMIVKVARAPFNVATTAFPLKLTPGVLPAWDTANAVMERGRLVRQSLRTNPAVALLLDRLEQTPLGDVQPLYVALAEGEAEQITWEALCDKQDEFVALDPRWPIGRISDPVAGRSHPPAVLRLPVRIMVVISAFKVRGQQREWEMVRAAAAKARLDGLDVRVKFLVAETALRTAIDEAIADDGLDWIEVSHIDKTASRVLQEVTDWKPNVLHFFCHGISDDTEQALELATAADHSTPGTASGSVKIRTQQLANLGPLLPDPWLLTLNCCSSGQAAKELQSMAHQVVSAGFPAAVAMLEPVASSDAHEFTRSFYASLFGGLRRVADALVNNQRVEFEWVEPMYAARAALSDLHQDGPANSREWALPVLYVRGIEPFTFIQPAAPASKNDGDHNLKARLVAQWLLSVRADLPEDERRAIMESVLAAVPRDLWPNVDGTFSDA
jgi:CHAT domain